MFLLIVDGQPSALRSIMPSDGQKVAFFQTDRSVFSPTLKTTLEDNSLDVVVIECVFNEKNGLEILAEIKKRRVDVPVIFVCSSDSHHSAGEALRLGARDCFKKPVNVIQFRERLKVLQKLKHTAREKRVPLLPPKEPDGKQPTDATTELPDKVLRVIQYVEDYACDRHISMKRLAKIAGMSPFHFCRSFKKSTSKSPMQYVLLVRVKRAAALLKNNAGNMSVSMIAAAAGFYDSSNLNKHFKKFTGFTPTAFKRSLLTEQSALHSNFEQIKSNIIHDITVPK
jgi:AraC-like DNA-binding protein